MDTQFATLKDVTHHSGVVAQSRAMLENNTNITFMKLWHNFTTSTTLHLFTCGQLEFTQKDPKKDWKKRNVHCN